METDGEKLYTVINIGTENMRVLVGRILASGDIEVLGYSSCHSNGGDDTGTDTAQINNIRKGEPRDMSKLAEKLRKVIQEVEYCCKIDILETCIYIGVTGNSIEVKNQEVKISIDSKDHIITQEDEIEVNRQAREALENSINGTSLMTYTRFLSTDSHPQLYSSVGQASHSLKASIQGVIQKGGPGNYHWIFKEAMKDRIENAPQLVLRQLYLSPGLLYGAFTPQDLQDSCLLIDLGAGVTSYCVGNAATILDAGHIPVGCNHIENDLMQAFGVTWNVANNMVRKLNSTFTGGAVPPSVVNPDDKRARTFIVEKRSGRRDRVVPVSSIEKVMAARLTEIFTLVAQQLKERDVWKSVGVLVYLAGGGALIPGVEELAAQVFKHEVHIIRPCQIFHGDEVLSDPRWVVPLGLLRMGIIDDSVRHAAHPAAGSWWQRLCALFEKAWNWR